MKPTKKNGWRTEMHACCPSGNFYLTEKWGTSVTFQFDIIGDTQGIIHYGSTCITNLKGNKTSNNLCSMNCMLETDEDILPLYPKLHTA